MMTRMGLSDDDPVGTPLRLVLAVGCLALVVFGVRVAVSRRFPPAYLRVTRLSKRQDSRPVRTGGGMALLNASLLIQQVPFLISMPYPVARVLLAVALLLVVSAIGWLAVVRH